MFCNKKIVITGHTGFKGAWLSLLLNHLGAKVLGISIDIPTTPSLYTNIKSHRFVDDLRCDICDFHSIYKIINDYQPDFIFHLAAQPLVSVSYENPLKTFQTNAIGTANILEIVNKISKNIVSIFITSDKVYHNSEWVYGYRENDRLGGHDPYSASKAMAELVINSYFNSYFKSKENDKKIGIARAGNVIGGGDWAKNRIVPDCMISWSKNKVLNIRNPMSTRPWQHVLEPLSGYLTLASALANNKIKSGETYNFGPIANQNRTVLDLLFEMKKFWLKGQWKNLSQDDTNIHEAGLLKLNCDKAMVELDWQPTLNFEETILMTANWYKFFYSGNKNIEKFTFNQIENYISSAKLKKLNWIKIFES